ncbi:hypothetical protein CDIK_3695 [Cucumispora dikerogammari]|nr:hypothetical protein CDIK_3695 [Cucumispora dikerogammari]
MIDRSDVFSNTNSSLEQTNTIQSSAAYSSEQLDKIIDCTPPSPIFYENIYFETLNDLTDPNFEIFSPETKQVYEQPDEFDFLSANEGVFYYPGTFATEEQNLLTNYQTSQEKDVYEKQRLLSKTKRPSLEIDGVVEPSDKKPKFNNEVKNKNFLIQNSIIDDRQNQLNISGNDKHNSNIFYTETMDHSYTLKQHKPDTYQTTGVNSNQIQKQIGRGFCQNTVCTAQNYTITSSQMFIQRTQNNKNIRTEFRLSSDQKDANIFKGIEEIETNTVITVCYMKDPRNTHVYGVREPTTCVKIEFKVNVTKSLKNEQTKIFLLIKRVPMFLCPVSSVYSVDLEYKVNELSTREYTFFQNIQITIIQPEVTKLCLFDILPKFTFISKNNFFRTGLHVRKIKMLTFFNAEFEIDFPKKTVYSNNKHEKSCLKSEMPRTHTLLHILSTFQVYKKAVENEKKIDPILDNAIKKLELLWSHLDNMCDVFIIEEEEDFKRYLSQIIEFIKNFCKEKESTETPETGTPKAKNLKRAFLKALWWFEKNNWVFNYFYDFF